MMGKELGKFLKFLGTVFIISLMFIVLICELFSLNFKNTIFIFGGILAFFGILAKANGSPSKICGNSIGEINAEITGSDMLRINKLTSSTEKGIEFYKANIEYILDHYILGVSGILYILIGIL